MQRDERDLLDVLKFELKVLERGGYVDRIVEAADASAERQAAVSSA